ncbi:MAG: cysteine hydrolase [Acidobacteria bacterium]|nr:cysteine hydrolase [Acidobacteriota bacterium]MBI3486872.1 cysteine hydrolase [Acidobacteriota bacterium]
MDPRALLVIDLQNDYFPGGKFPLWNPEAALDRALQAIGRARARGIPVILVQHVADSRRGPAPFFQEGSEGAQLHPRLRAAAPGAPVVVKAFADSFHETELEATLAALGTAELLVCGMMTQNCVTHTAISKAAEKYRVSVLGDCCASVSEPVHLIALNALSTRVPILAAAEALG